MPQAGTFTLTEASRRLGEPQHRLIHLCEKGVVQPDHRDAEGRGSSRRFSARNVLEFSIALRLREMHQPLAVSGAVVQVLRQFEGEVGKQLKGFRLPEGLRGESAPDLRVVLSDGTTLFFLLGQRSQKPKVFGGVALERGEQRPARGTLRAVPADTDGTFGEPEGSRYTRLELSITRIAQDLPID